MSIKKTNTVWLVLLALVVGLGYLVCKVWQSKPSRAELSKVESDSRRENQGLKDEVRNLTGEVDKLKRLIPPPAQG